MTLTNLQRSLLNQCLLTDGPYRLHSGGEAGWLFDLTRAPNLLAASCSYLRMGDAADTVPVGIEFGGAVLVAAGSRVFGIVRVNKQTGAPHAFTLDPLVKMGARVHLMDDTCTTGRSLVQAGELLRPYYEIARVSVVLDRSPHQDVHSILKLRDVEAFRPGLTLKGADPGAVGGMKQGRDE